MRLIKLKEKDWRKELSKEYSHPAIIFWRAVELEIIFQFLKEKNLKPPILDLGCGEGKIAKILFGKRVVDIGIDNEISMVKLARKSRIYKKVVLGDARKLPFEEKSFSTIFSNCVIEHIKEIKDVLSEISRTLKKNGLFIFTVPSYKFAEYLYLTSIFKKIGLSFLGKYYGMARNKQLSHFNLYSLLEWKRKLEKYGFKIIYSKYYLSPKDIFEWDKMCVFLKFSAIIPFVNKTLKDNFYQKISKLLMNEKNLNMGGGILIVAQKMI